MKRIAILQSNYIPWLGYFDIVRSVDEFILYDEVQYTVGDWRNRNRIKNSDGSVSWITIPVCRRNHLNQKISEIKIADPSWAGRHWDRIRDSYRDAAFFRDLEPFVHSLYEDVAGETFLSRINYRFIRGICRLLGINTPISWSTDYPSTGERIEKLLSICRQAGADIYLSGPAAKNYVQESDFREHGISLEWMDYSRYPEYRQVAGAFCREVSILDLLFNTGPDAGKYIWGFRERRIA